MHALARSQSFSQDAAACCNVWLVTLAVANDAGAVAQLINEQGCNLLLASTPASIGAVLATGRVWANGSNPAASLDPLASATRAPLRPHLPTPLRLFRQPRRARCHHLLVVPLQYLQLVVGLHFTVGPPCDFPWRVHWLHLTIAPLHRDQWAHSFTYS